MLVTKQPFGLTKDEFLKNIYNSENASPQIIV